MMLCYQVFRLFSSILNMCHIRSLLISESLQNKTKCFFKIGYKNGPKSRKSSKDCHQRVFLYRFTLNILWHIILNKHYSILLGAYSSKLKYVVIYVCMSMSFQKKAANKNVCFQVHSDFSSEVW